MVVNVKTPDEVIKKQIEEKRKQEEAEREARKQYVQAAASSNASLNIGAPAVDGKIASINPYPLAGGYWTNCTWSAWQMVYQNEGVQLPKWGNAAEWYYNAIVSGYSVDSNPKAGDVAVYGGNGLGHVAYVSEVSPDGNFVYVQQGNWAGTYSENWNSCYSTINGLSCSGYIHVK